MTTPNNMIYRTWRYSFWQLTLPVSSHDPISSQPFQNLKPYTKLGCPDFGHQIGEICRYFHPFPELLMAAQSDKCRASQQLLDGYTARHLCDSLRVTRQPPVIHERYVERWQTIGEWRANYRSSTRDVSNAGSPSASDAPTTGQPRAPHRTAPHRTAPHRIVSYHIILYYYYLLHTSINGISLLIQIVYICSFINICPFSKSSWKI